MPYLDDKLDHHKEIENLLIKLGFSKFEEESNDGKSGGLFSIFK